MRPAAHACDAFGTLSGAAALPLAGAVFYVRRPRRAKRIVVASTGGALMSVTFDALHAVLHMPVPKDALKRKHCYQLSYQLMRGGRKKLCIVEPHWMVSASRNRVEWYRVDARATPTEVSMSKL